MKIEFRKVPLQESNFDLKLDSVNFLGTFSKISSKLVKIDGKIDGILEVDCCKCGKSFDIALTENSKLLLSDGIYQEENEDEDIIIEIDDHIIDFDDILKSEIESIKSEYYICDECKLKNNSIELEY